MNVEVSTLQQIGSGEDPRKLRSIEEDGAKKLGAY